MFTQKSTNFQNQQKSRKIQQIDLWKWFIHFAYTVDSRNNVHRRDRFSCTLYRGVR